MTKHRPAPHFTVADLLADQAPPIRALTERLRSLVLAAVPAATETAQPGWRSISYRHPVGGYFCGIFPQKDDVLLAFEFGVLLPDPDALLEGKGTQVRFVRLRESDAIPTAAIERLLHAALDLPPERRVKLAMIQSGVKMDD